MTTRNQTDPIIHRDAPPKALKHRGTRVQRKVAVRTRLHSNSRLLRFDETRVTFRYEDYRRASADRQQAMTLTADEFIRRILLHALPKGFHRIRHYGLLAGATRKVHLDHARQLLGWRRYHLTQALADAGDFNAVVDYAENHSLTH